MSVDLHLRPLGAVSLLSLCSLACPLLSCAPAKLVCQPVKHLQSCPGVPTFTSDLTAPLNPNDTFHLIVSGASAVGLSTGIAAGGVQALFGVAPTPKTQDVRLSLGGTLLGGDWAGDRLGASSLEPRVRASVGHSFGILPVDVFVEGVAPHFFASGKTAAGVGGGLSLRLFSMPLEVGLDYIAGTNEFGNEGTASGTVRGLLSLGVDLFALEGVGQRTGPEQTLVDLRCNLLRHARSLSPTSECAQVTTALLGLASEPNVPDVARFIEALPKDLSNGLKKFDAAYTRCSEWNLEVQRECVDCTNASLSNWVSYTVDPHQVAAALGCIPTLHADDALCPAVDENVALAYEAQCVAMAPDARVSGGGN